MDALFDRLRRLLLETGDGLTVEEDQPGRLVLTVPGRTGPYAFFGKVEILKHSVAVHLMSLYCRPALEPLVTDRLRKRLKGKTCFHFKNLTAGEHADLTALVSQARSLESDAGES